MYIKFKEKNTLKYSNSWRTTSFRTGMKPQPLTITQWVSSGNRSRSKPWKAKKLQVYHPATLLWTSLERHKDLTQLRKKNYLSLYSNCVRELRLAAMTCVRLVSNSIRVLCSPTLPSLLPLSPCHPGTGHFLQCYRISEAVASQHDKEGFTLYAAEERVNSLAESF